MQNQPFVDLGGDHAPADAGNAPQQRLLMLSAIVVAVVCIIGARVCHIQAMIAMRFITPWEQTETVEEAVPARHGRILTRDGAVLAYDETRYDISLDYRWLESPFDSVWLRRQVYARLDRQKRGDRDEVERVEQELSRERAQLFHRLSQLAGLKVDELEQRASRIQKRIETMLAAVETQRAQRLAAAEPQPLDLKKGVSGLFQSMKTELTTPPRRYARDPIILKEELEPHVLIEDVPLSVVAAIESMPNRFRGAYVESHATRIYPMDDVAAHLVGLRKDQQEGGEGGVEQAYNAMLAGQDGKRRKRVNRRGEIVSREVVSAPLDGNDVVLTIDSRLQRTAEGLLDEALADEQADHQPAGGAVIVLDLWTGDVLAAASAPRFSLQTLLRPTVDEWQKILSHPHQPLFSRATQMALPPGSVFKVVTSAAALEQGEISPDDFLECRGYFKTPEQHRCLIYRNYGLGHGDVQLRDALCQSCNVFFFDLAERMGTGPIVDWADRFGFGRPTGLDLPGEAGGALPGQSGESSLRSRESGKALQLSIGQGKLLVTPLQVARMMAAIGNGGYLVTPRIVMSRQQQQESGNAPLSKIPGLSDRTLTAIQLGLEMVVHHPRGTGIAALTPSMTLAAKTGTAEVNGRPDHAWFAGYAPVESPRVAFCVVLEHGGSGGSVAGPIVKEVLTEMLGLGLLQPQWDDKSTQFKDEKLPTVVAAGPRDTTE